MSDPGHSYNLTREETSSMCQKAEEAHPHAHAQIHTHTHTHTHTHSLRLLFYFKESIKGNN